MRKYQRVLLSCLLSFCLLLSAALPSYAIEYLTDLDDPEVPVPTRRSFIFPDIYDGSNGVEYLLFQMHFIDVNDGTNTQGNSAKSFTKSTLTNKGASTVYIQGLLYHSTSTISGTFRTGIAYFDYSEGTVYPQYAYYPTSGRSFHDDLFSVSSLDANTTYFGFLTNLIDSGGIDGDVAIYYN